MPFTSFRLRWFQHYTAEDEANNFIKKYDRNGDGVLTKEELTGIFLNRESATALKTNTQARDNTQKAQTTAGVVGVKASCNRQLSREQMKEIFKRHDSDKDGFLNVRELTMAFAALGSLLPLYKAHYGLAYADADNDGLINEAELDKLIDYANKIIRNK